MTGAAVLFTPASASRFKRGQGVRDARMSAEQGVESTHGHHLFHIAVQAAERERAAQRFGLLRDDKKGSQARGADVMNL